MDNPIAYDLGIEWSIPDGQYWIVEHAVLADGSRVEMFRYKAHDIQIAQIRHAASWPMGSSAGPAPLDGGRG